MSALLAALVGIAEVRELLCALLIEAACQLEAVVKKVAEDMGRREVEEALREVLRITGDNVVKEAIEIPKAAAAMKAKQIDERRKLQELHEETLGKRPDGPLQEEQVNFEEQCVAQMQAAAYKADAANEAWQALVENADAKLKERDDTIIAEEGIHFWEKVGWTYEDAATPLEWLTQKCSELKPLDWARKRFGNIDCEVMATVFRQLQGPPNLRILFLSGNSIGDLGLAALCDATAFGALANLERLYLNGNKISDGGMAEMSGAMAGGRLANLTFLDMNGNSIGDAGMAALANAITDGAMAQLGTLYLHSNMIGDAGVTAFAKALSSSEVFPKLEKLWLYDNRIGDSGMKALSESIEKGALAVLKSLQLEGNRAMQQTQEATLNMLRQRAQAEGHGTS
eukprot:TRINITY_DN33603_c0_g1_i2.p1 TRINITY_DN33603_c0_g1~~TRINITY_DN33603_c0_g1_i2.p1  ORF type:complete len:398 (+),score=124.36 TRINITY_DN33603_c0_g1_i2:123-1316(+)